MVQLSLFNCERVVFNSSWVSGILLQGLHGKTAKNKHWLSKTKKINIGKLVILGFKYINLCLRALHKNFIARVFLALKSKMADFYALRSWGPIEVGWHKWRCFQLQYASYNHLGQSQRRQTMQWPIKLEVNTCISRKARENERKRVTSGFFCNPVLRLALILILIEQKLALAFLCQSRSVVSAKPTTFRHSN